LNLQQRYTTIYLPVLLVQIVILYFLYPVPCIVSSLSLHDALPICFSLVLSLGLACSPVAKAVSYGVGIENSHWYLSGSIFECSRSEEHTSELQSRENLVCRLLLEKKKWIS